MRRLRRIAVPAVAAVVALVGIAGLSAMAQTDVPPTAPLGVWCPEAQGRVVGQVVQCKVVADPDWTAPAPTTTTTTSTTTAPTTTVQPTTTAAPTTTTAAPADAPPANADNTGPRVASFTAATGSVFTSGTAANPLVISGRTFSSFVEVSASHVVIRDSKFLGGLGIATNDNVTVEYSEVRNGLYLASSWNTTVRATEIYGSGDLIHVTSDRNGRMVKNALFDKVWAHSDSTVSQLPDHVDGLQIRGVQGLTVESSVLDLGSFQDSDNGAYFAQVANGGHRDIRVNNSWLRGGYYSFRYEGTTGGYFEVTNCRFPYSSVSAPQYNPKQGSSPTLQSGNKVQKQDGSWVPLTLL